MLPNDGEGAAELITGPPRADRTADEVDLRAGHATLGGGVEAGTAATLSLIHIWEALKHRR